MIEIIKQISKFNFSSSNDIKYIVIHDTGNFKDTAKDNADYFCKADRQSSAHYFVDENSIYQVVEDFNASWHCGDGNNKYGIGNHNSIGIEMCNSGGFIADATMNNAIDLIKSLMVKYNIKIDNVCRHYDASRKSCPFNMSTNNWALWFAFKNKISGTQTENKVTTQPIKVDNDVLQIQKILNRLQIAKLVEDGILGNKTTTAIKKFQSITNTTTDGIIGQNTSFRINEILGKPFVDINHATKTFAIMYIQWRVGTVNDGIFGMNTLSALKAWQKANGLVADGQVGILTWQKMIG